MLVCSQEEEEEEEPGKEENSNTGFATVTFESEPGMVIFGEVGTASRGLVTILIIKTSTYKRIPMLMENIYF